MISNLNPKVTVWKQDFELRGYTSCPMLATVLRGTTKRNMPTCNFVLFSHCIVQGIYRTKLQSI